MSVVSIQVLMDDPIKLNMESDINSKDPLPDTEQKCKAPTTTHTEEFVYEVPIMPVVTIKCEVLSEPEPEPAERDNKQGGAVETTRPKRRRRTVQPREDVATEPRKRDHQCKVCHKCFSGSGVLKKHLRQHTGEKPYACNICQRRFTHNSSFQRHSVTHTGEKPYECTICQRRFTQESSLRTHLRTHTDEKPFECNLCHKHFARKYHLEEHLRVHTAEKPYGCEICTRRFTRKFSLRKHLRSCCGDDQPLVNLVPEIVFCEPSAV